MSQRIFLVLFFVTCFVFSQEKNNNDFFVDANYFYGTILRHNKDISHLIKNHPDGYIIGFNKKTFGSQLWQQEYNYPDWGFSFLYHNPHYEILGENYGLYGHFNFYFFRRNLFLRVAQGLTYNTNPFDIDTNFKNNAYGSHILSSTYLMLNYNKQNIFKNFGVQAGITLMHYSNGNFTAPNSSTNTFTVNLGVQYSFEDEVAKNYISDASAENFSEPIKYNFVFRGGLNESDYLNLGQHPFFVVSAFVDKRLSYKNTLQIGTDFFYLPFLKKETEYLSIAFPSFGVKGDEDYKRVGVFAGHELRISDLAVVSQVGYYVYYPYDFEGRIYFRAGLKYYLTNKIFSAVTLKSHGAKVEGVEFGVGVRL
ncbi:acyloxyacyl hydrolase [Aequorivita sp. Q41]|uniref:acyloxyacyl hydrolase n=1 Tax=Aequorivita sp. Q41 TaxID=3153300 RepID=UPI0032426E6B